MDYLKLWSKAVVLGSLFAMLTYFCLNSIQIGKKAQTDASDLEAILNKLASIALGSVIFWESLFSDWQAAMDEPIKIKKQIELNKLKEIYSDSVIENSISTGAWVPEPETEILKVNELKSQAK
jgi:hypothetical protein